MAQTILEREKAVVNIGKKYVTVITEPGYRNLKIKNNDVPVLHFEARDQSQHFVECSAFHRLAQIANKELQIGDQVVVDMSVEITAIDCSLEYRYLGCLLCIVPKERRI